LEEADDWGTEGMFAGKHGRNDAAYETQIKELQGNGNTNA